MTKKVKPIRATRRGKAKPVRRSVEKPKREKAAAGELDDHTAALAALNKFIDGATRLVQHGNLHGEPLMQHLHCDGMERLEKTVEMVAKRLAYPMAWKDLRRP